MKHNDHVNLLRPAQLPGGGTWADLGCGTGAFTLALRELVGPGAVIYAVDKDAAGLTELQRAHRKRFGERASLRVLQADLAGPLDLPTLDGVLMANSLHFFKDKVPILQRVRGLLRADGVLLIVEYNVDKGNPWAPFPFSFKTFQTLATEAGFSEPRLLTTHPSSFLRELYSAGVQSR